MTNVNTVTNMKTVANMDTANAQKTLRLTTRGKRVLWALVVVPLIAVFAWFAYVNAASAQASDQQGVVTEYVDVYAGDSLWKIAAEIAPDQDPRETISKLVSFNDLDSSVVHPGQRLAVPNNL